MTQYDLDLHARAQESLPRGHRQLFSVCLTKLCQEVEKNFVKVIMHFHYMTYTVTT